MRLPAVGAVGFHAVLRGTSWVVAEHLEPQLAHAGDIVLLPNGAAHGFSDSPTRLQNLPTVDMPTVSARGRSGEFEVASGCYHVGVIHPFLDGLPDVLVVSPDYDARPELRSLVDLLRQELAGPGPGSVVSWSALIDLVLFRILLLLSEAPGAEYCPGIADRAVTAVLHEIHSHPERPWTVDRLGMVAGMSRTAFSRRFTALVGEPPMKYLTRWRLTSAARLLRQTEDPLAAIARQVGYSTEFAFANAFRRVYGVAPGRFRRQDR